jgi:transposase-like protein
LTRKKKPSQASNLVEFLPDDKKGGNAMAKENVSNKELFGKLMGNFQKKSDPLKAMFEWLTEELMEAEMAEKIGADKYERNEGRKGQRAGKRSKSRRWDTRMGSLSLLIPKPRKGGYVPSFLERCQRSEKALAGVVMEAFIQGVSTRKMEKVAQAFGIKDMSATQVSNLCEELDGKVQIFLNRKLKERYPYLFIDALYEKIREDGSVGNQAAILAIGVNELGHREILGLMIMPTEDEESWKLFLRSLISRGLNGVKLVISDKHLGLKAAVEKVFNNGTQWQRCKVHTMRNILCQVGSKAKEEIAAAIKTIFVQPSRQKAKAEAGRVIKEFEVRFPAAMKTLEESLDEVLTYYSFPSEHWKKISSTNPLERLNREIRRRTRVVGVFPSKDSCQRLVGMVLVEQHEEWLTKTYMDPEKLKELYLEETKKENALPGFVPRSTASVKILPPLRQARELVLT